MSKRIRKTFVITFFFVVLLLPVFAKAAVVLKTINARQAYIDTFYNKTVAQLIYDESVQHDINPRLILVILQRESSAITQSSPSSETRRAWPMFYNYDERMAACLNGDEASCNDSKYNKSDYSYRAENYGGVGQQIAYATAQIRHLHDGSDHCAGSRTVSVDGQDITTDAAGSCVLYTYTPHISAYDTNSNFYQYWNSWWGGTPNGGSYSQTNIISEDNFRNASPMSASDINSWLAGKGSWLANYGIAEYISVPYPAVESSSPASTPAPAPSYRTGDINQDGAVNILDLSIMASNWGNAGTGDINNDGQVNLLDLSVLASNWTG